MAEIKLDGSWLDSVWLDSVMLFPNDAAMRDAYITTVQVQEEIKALKELDKLMVSVNCLRILIDSPSNAQLKLAVTESRKGGMVTGDIMACLYLMERFEMPEPSINKAMHVCRAFAAQSAYGDGTAMATSDGKMREYWNSFKGVSHLWAARRLEIGYPIVSLEDKFSRKHFNLHLACSQGLLEFATSFVPKRARPKAPILPLAEAWTLPSGTKALYLDSARYPAQLAEFLKRYKAPLHNY